MQKSKMPLPEPNIVETYNIDGSTIHICDNYVAKTPEEIEKVVKNLYSAAWKIVRSIRENGGTI